MLKPYATLFSLMARGLDVLIVVTCLYAVNLYLGNDLDRLLWVAVGAPLIYLALAELAHLYGSWRLGTIDHEFRLVLVVWGIVCVALVVLAFLFKISATYSRLATVVWFLVTPAPLLLARLAVRAALRFARRRGANTRSMAIAGVGTLSREIMKVVEGSADFGVQVVGTYDDRDVKRLRDSGHDVSRYAGTLSDMTALAKRGGLDYIAIALPMRAEKRIVQLVDELADTTASVYVIPDLFMFDLMRARWTQLGVLPAVSVYESPFDGLSGAVKRLEDIVVGTILLAIAALPMTLIAIALKLTSPGSIFFVQRRYGLNGKVVRVVKFRTMTVSEDGADVVVIAKGESDSRITPVGRFLRATSLDELPQLFNVLKGDMSLVGPRPHAVKVNEDFRRLVHGYMLRHKVKPGITGWAQVNGWHGEDTVESMQKRVEHDLEYMRNWSVWLDLKILGRTVAAVLSRRGAY